MGARLIPREAYAADEVAVGDSRRHKDDIIAAGEVVEREHAVDVAEAHPPGAVRFLGTSRLEPPHEAAPQTLERGGREDALGRPADAHRDVNARSLDARRD